MKFVLVVSMLTLLGACGVMGLTVGWVPAAAVVVAAVSAAVLVGVGALIDWGGGGKAD